MSKERATRVRNTVTWLLYILGGLLCFLALGAELIGLDFTPGFGIVQIVQLLVGITALTLAVYITLRSLRGPDAPRSLQADIGIRLAATGLVFMYVSGLSDLIQIGTHVMPNFERPYIGPLQLGGLILGLVTIVAGLLLYHTSRGSRDHSSMEFLLQEGENGD